MDLEDSQLLNKAFPLPGHFTSLPELHKTLAISDVTVTPKYG
jgi:hypothetical protein